MVPQFTNLFYDLKEDGGICVCVGKMLMVMLVTQCRVRKQKQTSVKCFSLGAELFANKSTRDLRSFFRVFPHQGRLGTNNFKRALNSKKRKTDWLRTSELV